MTTYTLSVVTCAYSVAIMLYSYLFNIEQTIYCKDLFPILLCVKVLNSCGTSLCSKSIGNVSTPLGRLKKLDT